MLYVKEEPDFLLQLHQTSGRKWTKQSNKVIQLLCLLFVLWFAMIEQDSTSTKIRLATHWLMLLHSMWMTHRHTHLYIIYDRDKEVFDFVDFGYCIIVKNSLPTFFFPAWPWFSHKVSHSLLKFHMVITIWKSLTPLLRHCCMLFFSRIRMRLHFL